MSFPRLQSCEGCGRHVHAGEGSCPFCGGQLPAAPAPSTSSSIGPGLARAAILAGVLAGCDGPVVMAAYGGPPPPDLTHVDAAASPSAEGPADAAADAAPDASAPVHVPAPAYGGPPPALRH